MSYWNLKRWIVIDQDLKVMKKNEVKETEKLVQSIPWGGRYSEIFCTASGTCNSELWP